MGWQSDLYCSISFNRKTYNSKYEVEEDLEEELNYIKSAKETLHSLAFMTEPKKFCDEDESPEFYIDNRLREAIDTIEESTINVYKLQLLLDNWDICHNNEGKAISLRDKELSKEDTKKFWLSELAFFDGDYVKTDNDKEENG